MHTKPDIIAFSDNEILQGFRLRDNVILGWVYQTIRPRIIGHLHTLGGSEQEAKDVFQEGVIVLFINVQKPDFKLTSSFYTYFHAICHNHWLKRFREKSKRTGVSLDTFEVLKLPSLANDELEYAERQQLLIDSFNTLGDGCRELLRLSVIEEKTPQEIIAQLGFGSLAYYYKRKSNCKDKLLDLAKKDARFGEI